MKRPLLLALVGIFLLGTGSALAFMNNACKTGHHAWCDPARVARHQAKIGAPG
jgi:hypothetical protein